MHQKSTRTSTRINALMAPPVAFRLVLVAAFLTLAECGSGGSVRETGPTSTALVANAPPAVGPDYTIGPGDGLNVFVWRNPDLSTTVSVRPDGKISIPLVEDMAAVGKTPSQLAT